jgi:H+/gluconate symporter-like permease
MGLSSFDYFILGVLVSIPITVIGGLWTIKLQGRLAKRSDKRAQKRIASIKKEYAEAKKYHDNPIQLVSFMCLWILWLTIYWILQSLLDSIFSFGANGSYFENANNVASLINTVDSLISVIVLTYIFRSGYRAYRIIKRVMNFDKYESTYIQEIADLDRVKESFQSSAAAVNAAINEAAVNATSNTATVNTTTNPLDDGS